MSADSSPLEALVTETRHAFVIAKSDGKLDAGEVVQIALGVAQKVRGLTALSGPEKKAVVLLTLKKGLEAAGGVPEFANATEDVKAAAEAQLLGAAAAAIDVAVAAATGKLDLRKPAAWKACLPACLSATSALLPKDQELLGQALKLAQASVTPQTEAAKPPSEAPVDAPPAAPAPEEGKVPETQSAEEPSPAASAPEPPAPSSEVKFE
jgi:hypothetical protein